VTSRQQSLDLALAGAVAAGCVLEVWAPSVFGSTHMAGPRMAVFAAYMVGSGALVFRRRFPLPSAAVVAVVLGAEWLAFGSPEGFGVFALLVLSGYSVGANAERRRALTGLALLLGAGAIWDARDPNSVSLHKHVAALVWMAPVVIAWLLGAYLRELRERARRAEREREERAAAAVVSERARIARELHDIVAHNVSLMVVQAEAAEEMLERDKADRARAPVRRIGETGRVALTDMRRLLGILRDADAGPALAPQPGIANLDLLLATVREAGLPVELEVRGTPVPLSPGVDLSAFRIVQEALTNALKYSGRERARVLVGFMADALELEVTNDGSAADGAGVAGGHGLMGMRERVALFGGELEAGPCSEGGYRVHARLPLGAEA